MGAIFSEIFHLLKVNLSLQSDQGWLLLLSWFSKFFGEDPGTPLPDEKIYALFFNRTLLNTSLELK